MLHLLTFLFFGVALIAAAMLIAETIRRDGARVLAALVDQPAAEPTATAREWNARVRLVSTRPTTFRRPAPRAAAA